MIYFYSISDPSDDGWIAPEVIEMDGKQELAAEPPVAPGMKVRHETDIRISLFLSCHYLFIFLFGQMLRLVTR